MHTHTGDLPVFSAPTSTARRIGRGAARMLGISALAATTLGVWSLSGATIAHSRTSRTPNTASVVVASLGRRASHNGWYATEVVAHDSLEVGRQQRWMLQVSQRNHRRLAHADVKVTTWAPETGEVSSKVATARYIGGGNYRLDGIYFPSAGWWNVSLVIDGSAGVDSVAFNVIIPPR